MKKVVLMLLLAVGGVFVFGLQSCEFICSKCPCPVVDPPPLKNDTSLKGLNIIPYFLEYNKDKSIKLNKKRIIQFDSLSRIKRISVKELIDFNPDFSKNNTKITNQIEMLTRITKGIKPIPIPLPLPSPICHCLPLGLYKDIDINVPDNGSQWKFEIKNGDILIATSQMGQINELGNQVLKINVVDSKFEGAANMTLTKTNGEQIENFNAMIQVGQN